MSGVETLKTMRRKAWIAPSILATLCVFLLISTSGPAREVDRLLALAIAVWALAWVERALLVVVARIGRRSVAKHTLVAEVSMLLITLALLCGDVPFQLRFRVGEAALTRYAVSVLRGEAIPARHPGWIGGFPIERVEVTADRKQVSLMIELCVVGEAGLAYSPDGSAAQTDSPVTRGWRCWVRKVPY